MQREREAEPAPSKPSAKKRKKISNFFYSIWFFIILALALLGSVIWYHDYSKKKKAEMKRQELEAAIKDISKEYADKYRNPEGVQFRDLKLVKYKYDFYLCGQVNAQNGYGGYSGFQGFAWTRNHEEIITTETKLTNLIIDGKYGEEISYMTGAEMVNIVCSQKALTEVPKK